MENTALFLHLVGAFLLVSGTAVAGVALATGRRRGTPAEIALLLGLARIGAILVGVGLLLAVVFGLWLVHLGHWGYNAGWISLAFVLLFGSVVTGAIGGQAPKRARKLATTLAGQGSPISGELRELLASRSALVLNTVSAALMVAVLVVMVWKPGAAPS